MSLTFHDLAMKKDIEKTTDKFAIAAHRLGIKEGRSEMSAEVVAAMEDLNRIVGAGGPLSGGGKRRTKRRRTKRRRTKRRRTKRS